MNYSSIKLLKKKKKAAWAAPFPDICLHLGLCLYCLSVALAFLAPCFCFWCLVFVVLFYFLFFWTQLSFSSWHCLLREFWQVCRSLVRNPSSFFSPPEPHQQVCPWSCVAVGEFNRGGLATLFLSGLSLDYQMEVGCLPVAPPSVSTVLSNAALHSLLYLLFTAIMWNGYSEHYHPGFTDEETKLREADWLASSHTWDHIIQIFSFQFHHCFHQFRTPDMKIIQDESFTLYKLIFLLSALLLYLLSYLCIRHCLVLVIHLRERQGPSPTAHRMW